MNQKTNSHLIDSAEAEVGYGQLFGILLRRWPWILAVFAAVMSVTAIKAATAPDTFQSSLQLQVEPNYQSKGPGGETDFTDTTVQVDTATQLTLMRSSQLLEKAVNLLRPQYQNISVQELQSSMALTPVVEGKVETKIFQVDYTDTDPAKSQKVLQALQKVYQNYNREQQKLRLTKGLSFIDEQLPQVQNQLEASEKALEKFRQTHKLVDPQAEANAVNTTLNAIKQEEQSIRSKIQELQARNLGLQQQLASTPRYALLTSRLSESNRYQSLLSELQTTEQSLLQQRLRFTDASPVVQQLLEQRQKQRQQLGEAARNILGKNAGQVDLSETGILRAGNLAPLDINVTNQLVTTQIELIGLKAQQQALVKREQQLRGQLDYFLSLMVEYNRIEPKVTIHRSTLEQLQKARQDLSLELARGGFDWQVVEEPQMGWKTGPNTKQTLLLGTVVGLMLGGGAAFAREMLDSGVRSADDLKRSGLPLLGSIPELRRDEPRPGIASLPLRLANRATSFKSEVIDWSPFRAAVDLLYKNLEEPDRDRSRVLAITSALAGEGKSTLAVGLAMSASRLQQRVLVIDANLHHPSLHNWFNLSNEQGLTTLLKSDNPALDLSIIQQINSHDRISILTTGPIPPDHTSLLSSRRLGEILEKLEHIYDLVILDTPPILGLVDVVLMGSFGCRVLMLARLGQINRSQLTQAVANLGKIDVIGLVANGVDTPSDRQTPYKTV
ncbi:MAG: polysaccharide biosynthesis tyrosine autokinase [Cyanosarcina radialis HA8281-LM2]|jgi:capsular exopolysaccharide synthesis family protein|nr:polysaccharide biosynthesis tyrosine autokinase [Cyanosarcina radialis HA8281-LM2]